MVCVLNKFLGAFLMRVLFRHSFFGGLHKNENRILNSEIRFSFFNFHKLSQNQADLMQSENQFNVRFTT